MDANKITFETLKDGTHIISVSGRNIHNQGYIKQEVIKSKTVFDYLKKQYATQSRKLPSEELLNEFLEFVDSTDWKVNNDTTNYMVINEWLNQKQSESKQGESKAEKGEWISVKDKLPEEAEDGAIDCELRIQCDYNPDYNKEILKGYYEDNTWWIEAACPAVGNYNYRDADIGYEITHWRPINHPTE